MTPAPGSASFTTSNGKVYLSGTVLSDHRIDDLLTFFQAQEAEAEAAASVARRAFNDLWEVRRAAVDARHNRQAA